MSVDIPELRLCATLHQLIAFNRVYCAVRTASFSKPTRHTKHFSLASSKDHEEKYTNSDISSNY
jgi:hypothetical protein